MAPATANRSCVEAWQALVRFGLSVLLISVVLSLIALPWSGLSWWKTIRRCVSIASAISLWLCIHKLERRSIRAYGFLEPEAGKSQLCFGLLLGASALCALALLGLLSGSCQIAVTADRVKLWRTVLGFIPAAALVGFLEELVFRGFILQHLLACSRLVAVITSSALYAVVHLKTTTFNLATFLELGGLFLLGVVLSLSYLSTGQLYLSIGLHAVLAYGARVNKLILAFNASSLSWLVGTSRLVNGLASWAVLVILGWVVVWWTRSSRTGGVRHGDA